jgi:hypothetical protein
VASGSGIQRIERLNYLIGAVTVLLAMLTQPLPISLGFAVGVGLTCLNFLVLRKLVVKWTEDAAAGRTGNAPMLMMPKMILLMGAVVAALALLPINAIAFTVGYSIFIASIVIDATAGALRANNEQTHG